MLTKPAKHAAIGVKLALPDGTLEVEVLAEGERGERVVRVTRGDLDAALRTQGEIPLPPYIRRAPEESDRERYQTVFARVDGAVASPTAGCTSRTSCSRRSPRRASGTRACCCTSGLARSVP